MYSNTILPPTKTNPLLVPQKQYSNTIQPQVDLGGHIYKPNLQIGALRSVNSSQDSSHQSSKKVVSSIAGREIATPQLKSDDQYASHSYKPSDHTKILNPVNPSLEINFKKSTQESPTVTLGTQAPKTKISEKEEINIDFVLNDSNNFQPLHSNKNQVNPNNPHQLTFIDTPSQKTLAKPAPQPESRQGRPIEKVEDSFFDNQDDNSHKDIIFSNNTVVLRMKSSLGGEGKEVGLTQIKLFDRDGNEIELQPKDLTLQGVPNSKMECLLSGKVKTRDPRDMLKIDIPMLASFVDLRIKYFGPDPGCLRIWNYNAEKGVGCKEIDTIVNSKETFSSKLGQAPLTETMDYYYDVCLGKGIKMPPGKKPDLNNQTNQEEIHPNSTRDPNLFLKNSLEHIDNLSNQPTLTLEKISIASLQKPQPSDALASGNDSPNKVYARLFEDDPLSLLPNDKESLNSFAKTRRKFKEGNVHVTKKQSKHDHVGEKIDLSDEVSSKEEDPLTLPKVQAQVAEVSRRAAQSGRNIQSDYRSRRDELKAKNQKEAPKLSDNLSDLIGANIATKPSLTPFEGRRAEMYQQNSKKKNLPPSEENITKFQVIGVKDSQVINLEESQPLFAEGTFSNKPNIISLNTPNEVVQKPQYSLAKQQYQKQGIEGDILDQLDKINNPLNQVRQLDKLNLSRLEISGLDFFSTPLPQKPLPQQRQKQQQAGQDTLLKEASVFPTFQELVKANQNFTIPELPKGKVIELDLYSNWGDRFYIGMCGIEVFNDKGCPLRIEPNSVSASPSDLNMLPDVKNDPRTPDKLVDGVYSTCDETHSWLAPHNKKGTANRVRIDFGKTISLSLLRLWNYNRNRVHSARGAREIAVWLDGVLIFFGVIGQASGDLSDPCLNCEYLVFCREQLYEAIDNQDWLNILNKAPTETPQSEIASLRPPTPSGTEKGFIPSENTDILDIRKQLENEKVRIKVLEEERLKGRSEGVVKKNQIEIDIQPAQQQYIECQKLSFQITANWGDKHFVGLTGVEFYDDKGLIIPLTTEMINANPRDVKTEQGNGDKRVLENLLNGINLTSDISDMWLTPFSLHGKQFLYFNFGDKKRVSGMKVWNYNASPEDSYRGVKKIEVIADLHKVSREFIFLKKAPGSDLADYSQYIRFPPPKSREIAKPLPNEPTPPVQVNMPPRHPTGFTLHFVFLSTWGDSYYIGLNSLEVFDRKGKPLVSTEAIPFVLTAAPEDITVLPGHSSDSRAINSLLLDPPTPWLAPYINPNLSGSAHFNMGFTHNTLSIFFSQPITLGAIRLTNYSKTAARGVKEFLVLLDEYVIFAVHNTDSG